jgi:Calcineurin-like phosphoesterase
MRTAVISDLHVGTRTRIDLLRNPRLRRVLLDALRGFDQLVLLGDALELRDHPITSVLETARPLLTEIGEVLAGGRVVLVPGNHDHRLAVEALDLRRRALTPSGLCAEVSPHGGGVPAAIRRLLGTDLLVAYPGFRVDPGVWATHGHYLDAHSNARTLECFASELLTVVRRRPREGAMTPDDYERVLAPTYDLFYAIAQQRRLRRLADLGKHAVRAVEARLGARGGDRRRIVAEPAPSAPRPPSLAGTRLGTAPGELRRPGLQPFGRVLERLGVEAEHVLFGHTHRTGPLSHDEDAAWWGPGGAALVNTGSWVYEPDYCGAAGAASPYWPGTLVEVGGGVPPRIHRLLEDRRPSELSQVRTGSH